MKNCAVSATGMPSVMMTTRSRSASTASYTAALAKRGGTKITETLPPVASFASATVAYTGTETVPPWRLSASTPMGVTSKSTEVPAFFGFVPATMFVPAPSMRSVCFMPSEPVMPWTMTRESLLRKIDIFVGLLQFAASSAAFAAAPSMVSTTVTRGWAASSRMRRRCFSRPSTGE